MFLCVTPQAHVATCCASLKTLRTCTTGFVSLERGDGVEENSALFFWLSGVLSASQTEFKTDLRSYMWSLLLLSDCLKNTQRFLSLAVAAYTYTCYKKNYVFV